MNELFLKNLETNNAVNLNESQVQGVTHKDGPLLLLATPGSGKTTVLNMRIAYLILEHNINPKNILNLTFSKMAAKDMENRFEMFFGDIIEEKIHFSTIHSFSYNIVRTFYQSEGLRYEILENRLENKSKILKEIFSIYNKSIITEDKLEELTNNISLIKNSMLSEGQIASKDYGITNFHQIYKYYENYKENGVPGIRLLDFDDMLVEAYNILNNDKLLLKKYREKYKYISIDESQDTSLIQHKIIELISMPLGNIFMVGDDDQSIFGFRAADPKYLLDFKKTYKDGKILKIQENFRSSQEIVNTANEFIKNNFNRYNKNMFTRNGKYKNIPVNGFENEKNQVKFIIENIKKENESHTIAILYRNNNSAIDIVNILDKESISFYIKDTNNKFFNHWVVDDVLNFFRLSFNDTKIDIFERIYTKCSSYVSKNHIESIKFMDKKVSVFENLSSIFEPSDYRIKTLDDIKNKFKKLNNLSPSQGIRYIREDLKYEKNLERICDTLGYSMDSVQSILNSLEMIADECDTIVDFANRLSYLKKLMNESHKNTKSNITLSTIHSSKGLEFDSVYIIDLNDSIIPSYEAINSNNNDLIEEERRLFYVGITRAKKNLYLNWVKEKGSKVYKKSLFINEIEKITNPDKYKVNDSKDIKQAKFGVSERFSNTLIKEGFIPEIGKEVVHRVFGEGLVMELTDEMITISFEKSGIKKLSRLLCDARNMLWDKTS
ncbi:DNA helicase-2/ATP-dependent DNA helicase PcrA [Acetoanaerobium pronyense]|uniref:DNA 3'-5' helicase n=1 Tax=Acetoanaerobium pronyense TaxID=1482736 RepID=A0ABS4KJA6_9FIRM|nr:ATP-dependent helicase [Acetoanaerobium pronyense]MBP2027872.1 DNA helicase-2/ATP-dependent DNA helicase PcrA [Acetoanaerobium pronyense]